MNLKSNRKFIDTAHFTYFDEVTMIQQIKSNYNKKFRICPEYQKMIDTVKDKIMSGELNPGDLLRSESFLSAEFNLSQPNVTRGLAVLKNEGYIFSIAGKGNYVGKKNSDPYELYFDELITLEKKYDEIKITEVNLIRPNNEICAHLKIHCSKLVVRIKRVYMDEKSAKIFEIIYAPYYRGMPIVEREINYSEFPEKVAAKKNTNPMTKKLHIKAGVVNGEVRRIFNANAGDAVLIVEQKKIDDRNHPITWSRLYFYGEVNKLSAVASL